MEDNETLILFSPLPSLPIFFSIYLLLYLLGHSLIFRSWSPNHRSEASSCLISLAHGTPAFFLSLAAVLHGGDLSFSAANTHFQNTVMNYSVAYFSTDLFHFLVFSPRDFIFILHHLTTLFGFLTCQYVAGHGAVAVLVLLAMGESTSLLQNAWTLAGMRRGDGGGRAAEVYRRITLPFCVVYTAVRGAAAPYFAYRMGWEYVKEEEGAVPRWVWVSWMALVAVFIPASLVWISGVWVEIWSCRVKKLV